MLSIEHSNNTDAAIRYFRENLAQADYYCEKTAIMGQWHGKIANELNLKDEVNAKDFEALLYNVNPNTGERLTARNNANRRPMYDCTFSSCKSASIVYAITGDRDILHAHQDAVKAAMLEIEANLLTQMGTGQDKHYEQCGKGVWAEFVHEFARPLKKDVNGEAVYLPDPQLHSHCTLVNVTHHEEQNRYRAIEMSHIKRMAPYYEALYHSHYGHNLKAKGYELEQVGKRWEIKGIERTTIEKYSGRTMQIEELAKQRGIKSDKAKAKLGRLTRNDKSQSVPDGELPSLWKDRLSLSEYHSIANAKKNPTDKSGNAEQHGQISPEKLVDLSVNHFMERNSAVPEKRILAKAIDMGSGMVDPEAIKKEYAARENLIKAERNTENYVTTRAMLREETKLIERAAKGKATKPSLNPDHKIQNEILNKGQREAVKHILQSQDNIMLLSGDAGVGKTTLLEEVKSGIEENGKQLFAFAPSSSASRDVLRSKGFEKANTIAMLLKNEKLQEQLKDQVMLIDEAGLVGVPTANKILDLAERQNARVVMSGDYKQHKSVEAGSMMRSLELKAGLEVARVNEIVRQRNAEKYKEVIANMAKGIGFKNNPIKRHQTIDKAFNQLDKMGSIVEIPEREEREAQIAKDYVHEISKPDNSVIVVAPTHNEIATVTQAIRNELKVTGKVLPEERIFSRLQSKQFTGGEKQISYHFDKNDVIEFHKNTSDFKSGHKYVVHNIEADGRIFVQSKTQAKAVPLPMDYHDNFDIYREEKIALAEGDKIRISKNSKSLDGKHNLYNGQHYDVKGFDASGNIKLSNGQVLSKHSKHFSYGYVTTSHAAQGRDAKTLMLAQSSISSGASDMNQAYVSISRGVENCKIYTDDKQFLKDSLSRERENVSAIEVAEASRIQRQKTIEKTSHVNHIKGFYEDRIKPSIDNIKTYYEERTSQREVGNRDIGLER